MTTVTRNNPESWMPALWEALEAFRENCAPEGNPESDADWDDLCSIMAWLREDLGLKPEGESEVQA
jgi:hypothetical protein